MIFRVSWEFFDKTVLFYSVGTCQFSKKVSQTLDEFLVKIREGERPTHCGILNSRVARACTDDVEDSGVVRCLTACVCSFCMLY